MIIVLHAHLGEDVVFDEEQTEEELITAYQENHVGGAIVQPYLPRIYMEDHRQIHDRIHRLCQESKEVKFWGMASINPHFRPEDYDEEAQRCIQELELTSFVKLRNKTIVILFYGMEVKD